jgi:uncharacterized membrane protein
MQSQLELVLMLIARWAHVIGAILLVGSLLYTRLVLLPAQAESLDESAASRLGEAVNRRFGLLVRIAATLLLLSGGYNFWLATRADPGSTYHMTFGIKLVAALSVLFLASVLSGRARAFEGMRKNLERWLFVTTTLALAVVLISGMLRHL